MSLVCQPLCKITASVPVGGKARGLRLALDAGLRTAETLVIFDDDPNLQGASYAGSDAAIRRVVEEALEKIRAKGWNTLAVRSSAQVEDGLHVSFAGQWKSYGHVEAHFESINEALKGVLTAGQAPTLQAYAEHFGIPLRSLRVAVLIQPWISAQISGVAFSLNPVSGEKSLLVEAVAGTSEALMEGLVEGQRSQFGSDLRKNAEVAPNQLLSAKQGEALKKAVEQLESFAGWPVDVEWAWDEEGLVILQVRPVTAFEVPPDRLIAWSRELTAERYPVPLSPLGWTNIKAVFDEGVRGFAAFMGMPLEDKTQIAGIEDGWVVANPDAFDFKRRFKVRLEAAETADLIVQLFSFVSHQFIEEGLERCLRDLKSLFRYMRAPEKARTKLGNRPGSLTHKLTGTGMLIFLRRVAGQVKREWPATLARFRDVVTNVDTLVANVDDPALLLGLGDQLRKAMIEYVRPDLVIFAIKEIASLLLKEMAILEGCTDVETVPARLGAGLDDNCTLKFHQALCVLRQTVQEVHRGQAGFELLDTPAVREFLLEFGHQTTSWDIMVPTFGEKPESMLDLLRLGRSEAPQETCGTSDKIRQDQAALLNRLGKTPWEQKMAREASAIMRSFMSIDEEHHFHTGRIIPVTRRLVLKLGKQLSERGVLASPDEIFWLTDGEVRELFNQPNPHSGVPLIKVRKQAWERSCRSGPPMNKSVKTTSETGPETSDSTLKWHGTGVSSGVGCGRVKKVSGLDDLRRLNSGDVLMVLSPDPALAFSFSSLSGLIAETGAMLSHGAVAAREYRLPAVFACRGVWTSLREGDLVKVDGAQGTVCLLERNPA